MNLVLFTHPAFLGLRSQDHFAQMLHDEFRRRGHHVALRRPEAIVRARLHGGPLAKWAGYIDQYVLFPPRMRAAMRQDPPDTLYVFCDQALGPWVPNAVRRPHVVHCHDLLALRSALGDIPENPTSLSGRLYQRYIRAGFRQARHFISISKRTRSDLQAFAGTPKGLSEVVYNGLNYPFRPLEASVARALLAAAGLPADEAGCLLHVGGGQWYKNTAGVVHLYAAYVRATLAAGERPLPLWMVSPEPRAALAAALASVPDGGAVRFFQGLRPDLLEALYSHARALLFPSLAEGFGWPIAEALACGCPVVTTGAAPMTEIGGTAAVYLSRLAHGDDILAWAEQSAPALVAVLRGEPAARARAAAAGRARAAAFGAAAAIERYLSIYRRVLERELPTAQGNATHARRPAS
ncbi:MAG: glycosyltransferase [Betaproteobacteria bacterium]